MRPKKTNKPVWKIHNIYYPDGIVNSDAIGAEIIHLETNEISIYNFELINTMYALKILQYNPLAGVKKVSKTFFVGIKHDLSFLEPYIEKRPTWDEFYMAQAQLYATRSTCGRLNVGAVLIQNNRMVAEGYNGSITDHPHCDDDNHLMYENGCKRTVHAEMNIITMCARDGISTKGGTIYVTHQPCPDCTKHLNQAGIKEIVYLYPYKHRYENNFHEGMTIRQYEGKELEFNWTEGEKVK